MLGKAPALLCTCSFVLALAACGDIKVNNGDVSVGEVTTCTFGDDAPCDDGDSCTADKCTTANECSNEPLTDVCKISGECYADTAALDVNICKVCDLGASPTEWTDLVCDDGNPCTADECDANQGCEAPNDDTLLCDDGQACTTDDNCLAGVCVATPCGSDCATAGDCTAPADPCQQAACNSGLCGTANAADGTACDNGDSCAGDVCASGQCVVLPCTPDCTTVGDCAAPSNPCLVARCDGGTCGTADAADGADCDNGDTCSGDTCLAGECQVLTCTTDCTTDGDCSNLPCQIATCDAGSCVYTDDTSAVEVCDGLDNDCDSETDEDWPSVGLGCDGDDADVCANGVVTCTADGTDVACVESGANSIEVCDGLDNDCDGDVDEAFPTLGQPCDGPDSDECANGVVSCAVDFLGVQCGAETATDIIEICDGIDNDCDGSIDNDATDCPSGETCSSAECSPPCTGADLFCGGSCVDPMTDAGNCGECGQECCNGAPCVDGKCYKFDGCTPRPEGQCDGCACETIVCSNYSWCCSSGWDSSCANECASLGFCDDGNPTTTCGTECVDLASDANNCGACGTVCGSSQICLAYQCLDLHASGQVGMTGITADLTHVYWTERGNGGGTQEITKAAVAGGTPQVLTTTSGPNPDTLIQSGTMLYWSARGHGSNAEVNSMPKTGGVVTHLVEGQGYTEELSLAGTHIYYSNNGAVYRVTTDGSKIQTISSADGDYRKLAADTSYAYWGKSTTIERKEQFGTQETVASGQSPTYVTMDSTHVYWRNSAGGIQRLNKTTLGTPEYVASGPDQAHYRANMFVGGTYVYWATQNAIWRAPKAGGTAEAVIDGVPEIKRFAFNGQRVFWFHESAGVVVSKQVQ